VFGPGFGERLAAQPVGSWSAPVASSYGWHVVRVDERLAPELPPLEAIRAEVAGDWRELRRREAERRALERLRARYDVVRAEPSSLPGSARAEE
jgi:parvulin-like peptidyl-prolyl isomerase